MDAALWFTHVGAEARQYASAGVSAIAAARELLSAPVELRVLPSVPHARTEESPEAAQDRLSPIAQPEATEASGVLTLGKGEEDASARIGR